MRVTNKMLTDKVIYNIQSAYQRMQVTQTQLATTKRVQKPSDDALAVAKTLKIRDLIGDNEQYQKNIDDATGWLDNTEPALDAISTLVADLKDIAVSGSSDTKSASEREALGKQVEALLQQLVTLGNTQYDQRYVFAGSNTLTKPYDESQSVSDEAVALTDTTWADLANANLQQGSVSVRGSGGGVYTEGVDYEVDYATGRIRRLAGGTMPTGEACRVSYSTDGISSVNLNVASTDGEIKREVAPGVWEQINVGGQEVLSSKVDLFGLMVRIKNALFKNDGTAVNAAINDIGTALDQVSSAMGKVGVARDGFDLASARMDTQNTNLEALKSKLEDTDMAEVAVRLQAEQLAYQSALSAASSILNKSLLDFLS
ncbi:MAG TPA: flagellar hook-associated protein FlgL [bacterium]|nr:flagellar hook-associated protein FlgL [bacterium]